MQNSISWGAFVIGAGVGAVAAYFVAKSTMKEHEKSEKSGKDRPTPPLPPPPGPEGAMKGHRPPNARMTVPLPTTAEEQRQLDQTICEVWKTYDEMPDRNDFLLDVLDEVAPQVSWPGVAGDHPSVHNLEAIVGYRMGQIGRMDSSKDFEGNFDAFCISEAVPPGPLPGQITEIS